MSEVSTISSAISRMAIIFARSVRMPSSADRSGASGCGRRVSLKRRISAALLASRKMRTGLRARIFRMRREIFGNAEWKYRSRTSTTMATLSISPRMDNRASVGINVVGRLSTQKYPRSSRARMAWDFPDPDSPVRMMNGYPGPAFPADCAAPAPLLLLFAFALGDVNGRLPLFRPRRPRRDRRPKSAAAYARDDRPECARRGARARAGADDERPLPPG